jgi:nuclear transport factor 2 (NTF2) superfamily protein
LIGGYTAGTHDLFRLPLVPVIVGSSDVQRPPLPPFSRETALAKVQAAEDAWHTRDAEKVTQAYSTDCIWRNRDDSFQGRAAIGYFLKRNWAIELHYRLTKELWAFLDNRISVRFECEWQHAETGQWYRSHGNEHWEFDAAGYMTRCDISANDIPIPAREGRVGP